MNPFPAAIRLLAAGAAATAMALCMPSVAQLYKYVDKDGKTVYTDAPPPGQEGKQVNVPKGGAASSPSKTALERDKELEKARQKSREEGKKSEETARNAARTEEACARARENYTRYSEGGRITKLNDKGERVYMEESEIAAGREKSRRDMDELCKKS